MARGPSRGRASGVAAELPNDESEAVVDMDGDGAAEPVVTERVASERPPRAPRQERGERPPRPQQDWDDREERPERQQQPPRTPVRPLNIAELEHSPREALL